MQSIRTSIRKYETWRKRVAVLTKKKRNKLKHALEGNKTRNKKIYIGWLNDKTAAKQKAVTVRDKLDLIL